MGTAVAFPAPRTVELHEYPDLPLQPQEVRLKTLFSGISAGTELSAYRGSNPYMHKQWDRNRRLFVPSEKASMNYPVTGWGYEEVGTVSEVGSEVSSVSVGDVVYGTWGHRSHHVVNETYAKDRIVPKGLEPLFGIFSQIGAIALNGVHDARLRIGETVAVFGLGVPGQIVAQLAKRSGVRVIGVDMLTHRLDLAQQLEAVDVALNAREGGIAERIKEITDGHGADVSIEVSGSTLALQEAIRATAYSAKVIAMGFYQGSATGLFLGEEFHHNRINVVCSQIFGVDPELTYRWNQLRLAQTVMRLQAEETLNLRPLITRVFPLEDAAEAFRLLDEDPQDTLQVVLDFTGGEGA